MITRCTLDDVEPLVEDLRLGYVEMAPFGGLDEEKGRAFIFDTIKHHILLKRINDGQMLGHMGLRVQSHWYTKDLALWESYCYVKPEYRKTRTAFELYKVAKGVAQETKLPFFYGTFRKTGADFERVHKFLQRQGGQQIGSQFFIGA